MAPRRRFAQRRETVGHTQLSLAKALRVKRSTVWRWENGNSAPQPWVRPRLAAELRVSAEALDDLLADVQLSAAGAAPRNVMVINQGHAVDRTLLTGSEIDEMKRRELLRLISTAGALLALPALEDTLDTERLAYARDWPSRLDRAALDEYTRLNAHLWQIFALSTSKKDTLPAVLGQLGVLTDGLQHTHTSATRDDLHVLAADLFQLAGEIYFDADNYVEAAHCYTLAASASDRARAYDLWACSLTRHAFIAVYEGRYDHAAPMLDLAAKLARRGDLGLSTRYWVAAVEAETFAGWGDLSGCQRALDHAEHVRHLTGPVQNSGWLRFDGSRLAEERGTCYVTLGRSDLAETALTEALRHDLTPRRRASVLTDLAIIGAHRRDADQITTYADAAIDTARHTGSGVIARKLRTLRPHLAPLLENNRVRQLDQTITALIGHTA